MRDLRGANAEWTPWESEMDRDRLIREIRNNGASWPALLGVYAIIVATMVLTAYAIT